MPLSVFDWSPSKLPRRTDVRHVAVAGEQLGVTVRALFAIAAWNVELPFGHGAVVTRCLRGPQTETFVPILDPIEQLPADTVVTERFRTFDFA
jgi:hypothetical protein